MVQVYQSRVLRDEAANATEYLVFRRGHKVLCRVWMTQARREHSGSFLRYSVSKRVRTAVGPSQQQHGQLGSSGQPWQANGNMHDIIHGFWQKPVVDCTCGFGNPTRSVCARRARCAQKHRCTGAQVPLIARDAERSLNKFAGMPPPWPGWMYARRLLRRGGEHIHAAGGNAQEPPPPVQPRCLTSPVVFDTSMRRTRCTVQHAVEHPCRPVEGEPWRHRRT